MRDRTRKPPQRAPGALKGMSELQAANARENSAKAARERHQREPQDIDWDAAVARLRKMLDDMEDA